MDNRRFTLQWHFWIRELARHWEFDVKGWSAQWRFKRSFSSFEHVENQKSLKIKSRSLVDILKSGAVVRTDMPRLKVRSLSFWLFSNRILYSIPTFWINFLCSAMTTWIQQEKDLRFLLRTGSDIAEMDVKTSGVKAPWGSPWNVWNVWVRPSDILICLQNSGFWIDKNLSQNLVKTLSPQDSMRLERWGPNQWTWKCHGTNLYWPRLYHSRDWTVLFEFRK